MASQTNVRRIAAKYQAEIREELAALGRYEAQHGSYPELVRAHYEPDDTAAEAAGQILKGRGPSV